MHRRVWVPVAWIVALFVVAGTLPRSDIRTWSLPVIGKPWLAAASWPVPALRDHRFAWKGIEHTVFMPSWPVPSLRETTSRWSPPVSRGPATPAAGPIEAGIRMRQLQAGLSTWVAMLLALATTWVPQVRAARRGQRHSSMTARIRTLAERGVDAGRIAQHAGLPRDAVRGLMRSAAPRRRA